MIFLAGSAASGKRKKRLHMAGKSEKPARMEFSFFHCSMKRRRCGRFCRSMYGPEELSKIEIDDTPAMMVERMAEIIAAESREWSNFCFCD